MNPHQLLGQSTEVTGRFERPSELYQGAYLRGVGVSPLLAENLSGIVQVDLYGEDRTVACPLGFDDGCASPRFNLDAKSARFSNSPLVP